MLPEKQQKLFGEFYDTVRENTNLGPNQPGGSMPKGLSLTSGG